MRPGPSAIETVRRPYRDGLPWKTLVRARANELEHELRRTRASASLASDPVEQYGLWLKRLIRWALPSGQILAVDAEIGDGARGSLAEAVLKAAEDEIAIAREAVDGRPTGWGRLNPKRLFRWVSGGDQETAWLALHSAEADLTLVRASGSLRAEIPRLAAKLDSFYSVKTEPGRGWTKILTAQQKADRLDRQALREIKRGIFAASDRNFERMRSFRNILVAAIVILVVVTALLGAFPAIISDWVPLCPPSSGECPPEAAWKVELLGALGGLLTALAALQKLRGYRNPYNLPFVQALLRIPAGALTGLLGVVILQSGVSFLDPVGGTMLVAYAVLFGAAQELVTRLIDQKANSIVEAANPSATVNGA